LLKHAHELGNPALKLRILILVLLSPKTYSIITIRVTMVGKTTQAPHKALQIHLSVYELENAKESLAQLSTCEVGDNEILLADAHEFF